MSGVACRYTAKEDCSEANRFKYKMKGGQCLPSCVGIGGEATFSDACANRGMFDAGPVHDADFCCTKQQMCAARTPPACADTTGGGNKTRGSDGEAGSDDSSTKMTIAIVGVSHRILLPTWVPWLAACDCGFAVPCGDVRRAATCGDTFRHRMNKSLWHSGSVALLVCSLRRACATPTPRCFLNLP